MNKSIVQKSREYVEQFLSEKLSDQYLYHDWAHTLDVLGYCELLGSKMNLSSEDLEILYVAALFHDTGFTEVYEGHEAVSQKIAKQYLKTQNVPPSSIQRVLACIEATKMDAIPQTLLEKVIKDADLSSLGTKAFFGNSDNLRIEWATLCNAPCTDREWYQNNVEFLENHRYVTPEAQEIFGSTKKSNLKKIKKMLKKEAAKETKKKSSEKISGNRTAQMMFKVALRNHIDLTNIADNKANIMLTISTGVLTFGLPIATSYLAASPFLLMPTIVLMITCLLTIIYATMATRPIKMTGHSTPELLSNGKTNLFFFGNFYKMKIQNYQESLKTIIGNEDYLENIIISDLFYLGKALGEKYAKLRTCYLIFMVGITITVVTYVVSFYMHTQGAH